MTAKVYEFPKGKVQRIYAQYLRLCETVGEKDARQWVVKKHRFTSEEVLEIRRLINGTERKGV